MEQGGRVVTGCVGSEVERGIERHQFRLAAHEPPGVGDDHVGSPVQRCLGDCNAALEHVGEGVRTSVDSRRCLIELVHSIRKVIAEPR